MSTKPMSAAVAIRWGQLLASVESARDDIERAGRSWDLMNEDDQRLLATAANAVAALEQRLWERKDRR